jgi:hypothetical protein
MATDTNTASIIPLHQPKTPLTPAQRARAYRLRQKAAGKPLDGGDASRHGSRHAARDDRHAVTHHEDRHAVTPPARAGAAHRHRVRPRPGRHHNERLVRDPDSFEARWRRLFLDAVGK